MTSKFMNMQLVNVTSSTSPFLTRLGKNPLFHIAKISHFFNVTILACFYYRGSELRILVTVLPKPLEYCKMDVQTSTVNEIIGEFGLRATNGQEWVYIVDF
jgi:hypothetical protein